MTRDFFIKTVKDINAFNMYCEQLAELNLYLIDSSEVMNPIDNSIKMLAECIGEYCDEEDYDLEDTALWNFLYGNGHPEFDAIKTVEDLADYYEDWFDDTEYHLTEKEMEDLKEKPSDKKRVFLELPSMKAENKNSKELIHEVIETLEKYLQEE